MSNEVQPKLILVATCSMCKSKHKIEVVRADFIRWQEGELIQ